MGWRYQAGWVVLGMAVACGPEGVAAPTETDAETESGTASDTGDGETGPSSATDSPPPGTMSGTATTTSSTTTPADSSGDPPPDTDDCPPGEQDCPCDVGAACDEGLDCDDRGVCVEPLSCKPLDEDPHDDEGSAYEVTDVGCSGIIDLGVVATIQGPQTDWFTFMGGESFGCQEQPGAEVTADVDLEVCLFIQCLEGNTVGIDCAGGGRTTTSPDGVEGCCDTNQAGIDDYDCSGMFTGKDLDAWISVGSDERVCVDYALMYSM